MAAIGILLLIIGAIITWGVNAAVEGADLYAIGLIVMAGGVLALIIAAIQGAGFLSMTNRRMTTERHASPDGTHYVEETRTS
jgi:hypothetical protein